MIFENKKWKEKDVGNIPGRHLSMMFGV